MRPCVQERIGHPRERHRLDYHHVRHPPAPGAGVGQNHAAISWLGPAFSGDPSLRFRNSSRPQGAVGHQLPACLPISEFINVDLPRSSLEAMRGLHLALFSLSLSHTHTHTHSLSHFLSLSLSLSRRCRRGSERILEGTRGTELISHKVF